MIGSSVIGDSRRKKTAAASRFIPLFFLCSLFFPPMLASEPAMEYRGQRHFSTFFTMPFGSSNVLKADKPEQPQRYRIRFRSFGNWSRLNGWDSASSLTFYSYGVSAGIDRQVGQNFLHGFSLSGSETNVSAALWNRQAFTVKPDFSSMFGSGYFRWTLRNFYVDAESGLGYNEASRPLSSATQWYVNGEVGTWRGHGLGKIEPYLGLRHSALDADSDSKTTLIGGIRYSWKTSGALSVTSPRFYGGVIQELGGRNVMDTGLFVDSPAVFSVQGYRTAETRLFFGGGLSASLGTSLDLYFRYTAETASGQTSHGILGGMHWNF